jgi:hypothetical protein
MKPVEGKDHVTSHLQQLYKYGSKATEESSTETGINGGGPGGKSNVTSAEA